MLLLLAVDFKIFIRYDNEGLCAYVRYLFVKYQFYPEKPPKQEMSVKQLKKLRKKLHKKAKKSGEKKGISKKKAKKKKKGFSDILELVKEIADLVFKVLGKGIKYARFHIKKLDITVATQDAAITALTHTAVCNLLNSVIKKIELSGWKIKYGDMECRCDYFAEKFSCEADIVIKIRAGHLIYTVLYSLINYFKFKNENGGNINGKQDK
ncbi:MAG: hypothetical protein IKU52_01945 [Clostridia bacterium]|nr:hypothetical protein [Clostridia bacterium]